MEFINIPFTLSIQEGKETLSSLFFFFYKYSIMLPKGKSKNQESMLKDQYAKRLRLLFISHTLKSKPRVIMLKHRAFGRHLGLKRKQAIKIRAEIENRKIIQNNE